MSEVEEIPRTRPSNEAAGESGERSAAERLLDRLHTTKPAFLTGTGLLMFALLMLLVEGPDLSLVMFGAIGFILAYAALNDGGASMKLRDHEGKPLLVRSDRIAMRPWARVLAGLVGAMSVAGVPMMAQDGEWGAAVIGTVFGAVFIFLANTGGGYLWVKPPAGGEAGSSPSDVDPPRALDAGDPPFQVLPIRESERVRRDS